MVAIALLKPEQAARRAKANVAAFKTEQARKAAEAKLAERRAEEADTTPLPRKKSPSYNKEKAPAVPRKNQQELNKSLLEGAKGDFHDQVKAHQVKRTLDAGADVNARDDFEHFDSLRGKYKGNGGTALMGAARLLHEETMQVLIDAGADPNMQRPDGKTALMLAAREGGFGHVEMLLKAGADPNLKNSKGQTALMIGVNEGGEKYFHELVGHTIMRWDDAEKRDYVKAAEALVANGADVDSIDNEGVTPLMRAAYHGMADIVQILAGHKADVNATDSKVKCVLKYAREGEEYSLEHKCVGTEGFIRQTYDGIISFLESLGATE